MVQSRYRMIKGNFGMLEPLPAVWKEPHLVFVDEEGRIRAGCYFGDYDWSVFDLGLVPDDVISQGKEAVIAHAEPLMRGLIETEKKRLEEAWHRRENIRREFEVIHEGVKLTAVITKGPNNGARDNQLILTMTEPFQLTEIMHVRPQCVADGMGNIRTFDEDGNFLPQEIKRQEEYLVWFYKKEVKRRKRSPPHALLADLPRLRFEDHD